MPIKIPNQLPATQVLESENIFVMTESRAMTQDIRPLQVLLLNLMPTKIDTETQLLRLLGNTSLQVENGPVHGADNSSAGYGWQLWLNMSKGCAERRAYLPSAHNVFRSRASVAGSQLT